MNFIEKYIYIYKNLRNGFSFKLNYLKNNKYIIHLGTLLNILFKFEFKD